MSDTAEEGPLEVFINLEFEKAGAKLSNDDVEYLARFMEEDMEVDDKREGFVAMVEGFVEMAEVPMPIDIEQLFQQIFNEWERRAEASLSEDDQSDDDEDKPLTVKDILSSLTPEELAAAQKAAILRQYAYVDQDDEPSSAQYGDGSSRLGALATKEEKAAEERRKLIEQALKLDSKKKKFRKQQEVDLLAPNLNAAKVAYAAQMQREAARNQAKDKKDRDRAALEKQKADIAKAKADKQKKAAKVERRA